MPVRKHIARQPPWLAQTRFPCLWRVAVVTPPRLLTPNGLVARPPPYSGRVGLAGGIFRPGESVLISDEQRAGRHRVAGVGPFAEPVILQGGSRTFAAKLLARRKRKALAP